MKFNLNLIFLFLAFWGHSQNATIKSNSDYQKAMNAKAKNDIATLKNGVLLVRLKSRSQEIQFYKNHNNQKTAQEIEIKTRDFNQNVIKAFRQGYNFCPVYFFIDTFSRSILKGNFNEVLFLTDSLTQDATIKVTNPNYFIAELGITEGDTSGYRSDYLITTTENGTEKETILYTEENLHISAFVIRDKRFVMLHDPFPYYAKIIGKSPSLARMRSKIFKWNSEISSFYGE